MPPRIVEIRQNILRKNDIDASALRRRLRAAGVTVISLVSSPGSGKTALLEVTLAGLGAHYHVAALVGDLATDRDATRLGAVHPNEPFAVVFLDPPYRKGLAEKALASLRDGGWLAPGALAIVEEAADARFAAPQGYAEIERRRYDDTDFVFLRKE